MKRHFVNITKKYFVLLTKYLFVTLTKIFFVTLTKHLSLGNRLVTMLHTLSSAPLLKNAFMVPVTLNMLLLSHILATTLRFLFFVEKGGAGAPGSLF